MSRCRPTFSDWWRPLFVGLPFGRTCGTCLNPPLSWRQIGYTSVRRCARALIVRLTLRTQCGSQKHPLKILFYHFLSNCREFWREILHTYYLFIFAKLCWRACYYPQQRQNYYYFFCNRILISYVHMQQKCAEPNATIRYCTEKLTGKLPV